MNDNDLKYWIALKSVIGVGNVTFSALVEKFDSLPDVFGSSVKTLEETDGISRKIATAIAGFKGWDKVKEELELIRKKNVSLITCKDELYPKMLLNVYDRPPYLYVAGNLMKEDIHVAVIGSRAASAYGKYTTEKISRELALKGITVVSGMARGIDSSAHRGALTARGRTVAVLGSGLDIVYPPENKKLFTEIAQNGAVISEYPLGTAPRPSYFPARNRIISGMSYGVVVVEAGEKSGSLITARLALDQGREVFAVPGSIDSAGSRGTNKLIKQGAKLIEGTDDILEEILPQIEHTPPLKQPVEPPAASTNEKKIRTGLAPLNPTEQKIIDIVTEKRLHIDDIITLTRESSALVLSALMTMELNGIVEQHPGKFFTLKK